MYLRGNRPPLVLGSDGPKIKKVRLHAKDAVAAAKNSPATRVRIFSSSSSLEKTAGDYRAFSLAPAAAAARTTFEKRG